jgi:hypothetical protein
MASKEGFLLDYLVAGLIGFLFGEFALGSATGGAGGDMIKFVGILFVADVFFTIPGGMVASYLNFRFHAVSEKLEMEGLSAGFFTAFVYTIITLFQTIISAVLTPNTAGGAFLGWLISVLFAFVFFMIGGYFGGMLEKRPFAMPGIFNLSHISRAPPPPPTAAAPTCPTCGQPLTFIQQYNRWYCQNEKKYV